MHGGCLGEVKRVRARWGEGAVWMVGGMGSFERARGRMVSVNIRNQIGIFTFNI